jgi:hypothetical protein
MWYVVLTIMAKLLRFIGIINAAVWLGSAVFVTVGLPVVFSKEVGAFVPHPQVGIVAETILARFTVVQYCCVGIALVHLFAEHLLAGRKLAKKTLILLVAVASFSLVSGLWLQPKMRHLHYEKYWGTVPSARKEADQTFGRFHGASQAANLLVIATLVIYVWTVNGPQNGNGTTPRFSALSKIRS